MNNNERIMKQHERIEQYLDEHPGEAKHLAIGAVIRLSGKMTLKELRQWHQALCLAEDLKKKVR